MVKSTLKKTTKRSKQDWSKWSNYWKLLTECARPSKDDLKIIGTILNNKIKHVKNPVITILGSTPEFRDLCYAYSLKYNAKVVCIELVKDMHSAMSELLTYKNPSEKVIFSNWLSIDLPNNYTNIVLADLTEGNININLKNKYLSEINRILKTNGIYVTRHTAFTKKSQAKPLLTLSQIKKELNKYINLVLNGDLTMHQAGNFLGAQLTWYSHYKTKEGKNLLSIYNNEIKQLKKEFKHNKLANKILNIFDKVWMPMQDKYWEYYDINKTIKHFKSYFKTIKYSYSNDYPVSHITPIFKMTKKDIQN